MLGDATMPAPVLLPTGEALATLAHELRDPLAAIVLALELHSGNDDPATRRTLTMAAHQARRVVRIVDDLFDLCAGSRDCLPICKEVVDLVDHHY
jgi:signal transduction histidine kinase